MVSRKRVSAQEKEDYEKKRREVLDEAQPLLKASFVHFHERMGVPNIDGKLILSGCNKLRMYVAFDVATAKDLAPLIDAGIIDPKQLTHIMEI